MRNVKRYRRRVELPRDRWEKRMPGFEEFLESELGPPRRFPSRVQRTGGYVTIELPDDSDTMDLSDLGGLSGLRRVIMKAVADSVEQVLVRKRTRPRQGNGVATIREFWRPDGTRGRGR